MNTSVAQDFLTRCFAPGETIALLLRRENPALTRQRIVRLEQAFAPRYLRWLAHENATGMNIYVAANPLRSGSRRRTKESIAEVRHLYIDIDFDGDIRLASLQSSDDVPTPTSIVSTSPGKYQVLWQVEGFDFAMQEITLKQLAFAFGGDTACTDCNRVIRVPGFYNCKYTPPVPVAVEYVSDTTHHPGDFHLADCSTNYLLPLRGVARSKPSSKHTNSERDWAWVLAELKSGKDAVELTASLASHRSDKPNPRYYAQRTVDLASARLALLAGIPIHDVITELEARHLPDIPVAHCSARAREIAHTAERFLLRKNID